MPDRLVIANTSPLFYLHRVDCLNLVHALYGRIVVPPAVLEELVQGSHANLPVPDIRHTAWIQVEAVRSRALIPAIVDLGPGEAEVLALGIEHPDSLLILDDQLARRVAALNSLAYTGTLGLLVKAKRAGHLVRVHPTIERLRASGLWMTDDLVAQILAQAGE